MILYEVILNELAVFVIMLIEFCYLKHDINQVIINRCYKLVLILLVY